MFKSLGNKIFNDIFEGALTLDEFTNLRPIATSPRELRQNFIVNKYQHRKWFKIPNESLVELSDIVAQEKLSVRVRQLSSSPSPLLP